MATIHNFEDQSLSAYSGDTGDYSIVDASSIGLTAPSNTYILQLDDSTNTGFTEMISTAGLSNYFPDGTIARCYWRQEAPADFQHSRVYFGVGDTDNWYAASIGGGGDAMYLYKRTTGGPTVTLENTFEVPITTDTWYITEIERDQSGGTNDIIYRILDTNENEVESISVDNETELAGNDGIGFGAQNLNTGEGDIFWDDYHTTSTDVSLSGSASVSVSMSGTLSVFGSVVTALPDASISSTSNPTSQSIRITLDDTTNNGDYRWQIRQQGESTWDSNAAGFQEATSASDSNTAGTQAHTFSNLAGGTTFEVRARSETEHVTGNWTAIETVSTGLSAPTNVNIDEQSDPLELDLTWTNNHNSADGIRVLRAEKTATDYTNNTELADLASTDTDYTDSTVDSGTTYRYILEVHTSTETARSDPVEHTTGGRRYWIRVGEV